MSEDLFHLSEQFGTMATSTPEPDALPARMARDLGSDIEKVAIRSLEGVGVAVLCGPPSQPASDGRLSAYSGASEFNG